MRDKTPIEWTDASWNPTTGCSHVSAGCEHCYAEALSLRFGWSSKPWTAPNAAVNIVLHPDRLDQPLRWKRPRRIFVNSMSDLFHEQIPDTFIVQVFQAMSAAKQHTFQVLTKRPQRMLDWMTGRYSSSAPLANVWLGVSIEEDRWCTRADILRQVPAAVRFISAEPLLEPLPSLDLSEIHWIIVGGESGPRFRPFDPAWAAALRDQARASDTAFFFKQHGGATPKSGGRLLDGRTWDEMPAAMPSRHENVNDQ